MRMRRYVDPDGRVSHTLTVWRLQWDTSHWSLAWRVAPLDAPTRHYEQVFALCCMRCHALTLGCTLHWFCGLCRACHVGLDDDLETITAWWIGG